MKLLIPFAVLLLGVVTSAGAQQADDRWTPFIGCWELVGGGATVCVSHATPGGVTLSTRVEGEPVIEESIVADGAPHAIGEAGCTGSQRAEWSRDGRKLFARADLTCANQPPRTVTGLALMTGESSWIDVQAIEIADRTNVRVRRYRRAAGDRARAGASVAPDLRAARFTVEDVKEASAKVSPAALEAAIAETRARFVLSARDLIGLDDAGVPDSVIDLMIAVSYPEKFQVERRAGASLDMYPPAPLSAEWGGYWGLGDPYLSSYPGYYGDPGYYGNYRYYYSPFGYGYAGLFGPSSYYYPGSAVVIGGGVATPAAPSEGGDGRVVNGVGYTRVRTREAAARETAGGETGGSRASGSSDGGGTMTSSGATQSGGGGSSSGGGGSSSSGGGSSGSGSSDGGGRTAQPR